MGSINSQGSAAKVYQSEPRIALHETQHAIQRREGFDPGASDTHIKEMKEISSRDAKRALDEANSMGVMRALMDREGLSAAEAYKKMMQEENYYGDSTHLSTERVRDHMIATAPKFSTEAHARHADSRGAGVRAALKEFPPLDDAQALEAYHKNMGEVEARTTEARRHLTLEERRARFPMKDYDRPPESLYSQDALYAPRTRLNPENLKSSAGADRFINKIVGP